MVCRLECIRMADSTGTELMPEQNDFAIDAYVRLLRLCRAGLWRAAYRKVRHRRY